MPAVRPLPAWREIQEDDALHPAPRSAFAAPGHRGQNRRATWLPRFFARLCRLCGL